MALELVIGFVGLVVASYIGTTLALRGYFGAASFERLQRRETVEHSDGDPRPGDSSAED